MTSASTSALTLASSGMSGGRSSDRFNWMYSPEELGEWVAPVGRLAAEAAEVYALF